MRSTLIFSALLLVPLAGLVSAQPRAVYERQAEIRGQRSDEGKCTIEVDVDDVAEVEVRGARAWLRTLAGQPATWRRFVCSEPIPPNPVDFRFQGIDGRGRVNLVQDPRRGGRAVVRIEDPKGGREGYTFDLIWRAGGYGGARPEPGYDGARRPDPGPIGGRQGGNWREVEFRGRGEGFYRNGRSRDRLYNCEVTMRRGEVRVRFETDRRTDVVLTGRIARADGDVIYADMSGTGIDGSMLIELDRDRVRRVEMSGQGRFDFELRWRR